MSDKLSPVLEKVKFIMLLGVVGTLSCPRYINSVFIIILSVLTLFSYKQFFFLDKKKLIFLFLLSSIYLLAVLSLIITEDIKSGLFTLEKQLSLLLLPFACAIIKWNNRKINLVIIVFQLTMLATIFYCEWQIIIDVIKHKDYKNMFSPMYTYYFLSGHVGLHPIYLGMYILFSFIINIVSISKYIRDSSKKNTIIYKVLFSVIQIIFIFQLAGRTIIIITTLLVIILTIYSFIKFDKIYHRIFIIISFLLAVLVINKTMPFAISRTLDRIHEFQKDKQSRTGEIRIDRWKSSITVIKNNFWIGVGSGDTQNYLTKQYKADGLVFSAEQKFNTHNQYLDFILSYGVFGIIIWLFNLIIPINIGIKNKDYIFLGFFITITIVCLTENILSTNKGIVFYSLFNSIFVFFHLHAKDDCNQ